MATPFQTALNVAGGMRQSSPQAVIPKIQPPVPPVVKTVSASSLKPKNPVGQIAQPAAVGRAMNKAIKNTNVYR